MKLTTRFWKGLFIGCISILPGVSGSIVAMSLGLYDQLLLAVTNLWQDFKKQFIFLFPIGLGYITAFFILSRPIDFVITKYNNQARAFFIGITAVSIIRLLKIVYNKSNDNEINLKKIKNLLILISFFSFGIITVCLLSSLETINNNQLITTINTTSFILFVLVGMIDSFAKIVPGISSSSIMMALGVYSLYLQIMYQFNWLLLLSLAIGLLIGGSLTAQLMSKALKRQPLLTYIYIIGIAIASVFNLFPNQFNLITIMWVIMGIIMAFFFD